MKLVHNNHFPNESDAYRIARNELLEAEIALRKQTEKVAKLRRQLPLGGKLKQEYVFMGANRKAVKFSELFKDGKDTLIIYNMMFDPSWDKPCRMCNSIVDGLNGNARQIMQRVNLVIVGKAPIEKLNNYAKKADWKYLNIISSFENTYNTDYFGESDGEQGGMTNVFIKNGQGIYHTWGSELTFAPTNAGQDDRAADIIWPLWNILDLTPEGRGDDWRPEVTVSM